MATGTAGSAARNYNMQMIHFIRKSVAFGDSGVQQTVGVIPAGSMILTPISGAIVTTLFNDSGTDLIDIGISTNDDLLATDLDVSSVGVKTLDEAMGLMIMSTDVTITATYTGENANASTGAAEIVIAYIPDIDG